MVQRIKFLGFAMLFVFTATIAFGQKCKYDYKKNDPITGEESKGSTFSIKIWWKLGLNKNGNQYFVGMFVRIDGNIRDVITPENTIIFKLENGDIITVNANEHYAPSAQAGQRGVHSDFRANYNISPEDMQKLAASPLTHIRMGIGTRVYDESFSAKRGKSFQNIAKCIL